MRNAVGRPSKVTDEVVRKLLVCISDGMTVTEACVSTGISRETYYYNLNQRGTLLYEMSLFREDLTRQSKQLLIARIAQGDATVARWWLMKKCPDEFGR